MTTSLSDLKVERPIRLHIHEYNEAISQGSVRDYWRTWAQDNRVVVQACYNPRGWVWNCHGVVYKDVAFSSMDDAIIEAASHLVQWMGPTSLPIEFTPTLLDKPGALRCSEPVQPTGKLPERDSSRSGFPPRNAPLNSVGELLTRLSNDIKGKRPCSVMDLEITAILIEKHLKAGVWIAEGGVCSDARLENAAARFPDVTYLATNKEWLEFEGQKYYLPESAALANLQRTAAEAEAEIHNVYGIDAEPNPHGDFSQRMAYATSPQVVKSIIEIVNEEGTRALSDKALILVLSTYHTMLCARRDKTELAPEVKAAVDTLITVIRGQV